jgi:hypothetical protein
MGSTEHNVSYASNPFFSAPSENSVNIVCVTMFTPNVKAFIVGRFDTKMYFVTARFSASTKLFTSRPSDGRFISPIKLKPSSFYGIAEFQNPLAIGCEQIIDEMNFGNPN